MRKIFAAPEVHPDTRELKSTWMELFYDLAFVVAVAVIADQLGENLTAKGLLDFLLLFISAIFAWGKFTFYAGRYNTDDSVHRVVMLVQMTGVAAMAIAAHHGFEEGIHGFAVGFVVAQAALLFLLARVWYHFPERRPLNNVYVAEGTLVTGLWILVFFLPEHAYPLVGAATVIDLGAPIVAGRFGYLHPLNETHFPERFGLFSIIVLGEIVAATVRGGQQMEIGWGLLGTGFVALVVAFSLWWLYFENVRGTRVQEKTGRVELWAYTHIPWVIGLATLGIGIQLCITEPVLGVAQVRVVYWSAALALLCLGLLQWIIPTATTWQAGPRLFVAVCALLAGLVVSSLSGLWVLISLAVGVLAIIAADVVIKRVFCS